MKKIFSVLLGAGIVMLSLFSCKKAPELQSSSSASNLTSKDKDKENADHINVFKGPEVQMGNGKARSWITITHSGVPMEIGIELTDEALYGLPQNPLDFAASRFVLPLHQKAKEITPFDHITINWNVHGHEPDHVFDIPHFDFHFYMISLQAQLAIPPYQVAPAAFDNLPPVSYWPDFYVPTPGGVPQMGKHWINVNFHPPFTKTMIYGSYNGMFTFVEPMITRDFLLSGQNFSEPYTQPHVFVPAQKFYPRVYNIYRDENSKHYITLSDFVLR